MELESQKTQRLREDFVTEKSKGAELVSRLRSVCAAIALNGGKIEVEMDDHQVDMWQGRFLEFQEDSSIYS